jgi:hypothetical protein
MMVSWPRNRELRGSRPLAGTTRGIEAQFTHVLFTFSMFLGFLNASEQFCSISANSPALTYGPAFFYGGEECKPAAHIGLTYRIRSRYLLYFCPLPRPSILDE